jgi:hypothetical protein
VKRRRAVVGRGHSRQEVRRVSLHDDLAAAVAGAAPPA